MVHAGKLCYLVVMAVTGTKIWAGNNRGAAAEELVAKMHKQFRISGGRNKDGYDYDDDVKGTALSTSSEIVRYVCGENGHKKINYQKFWNQTGNT